MPPGNSGSLSKLFVVFTMFSGIVVGVSVPVPVVLTTSMLEVVSPVVPLVLLLFSFENNISAVN